VVVAFVGYAEPAVRPTLVIRIRRELPGLSTSLQRAGEHESCLQGCALGATGLPSSQDELVPTSQVTRLSQALGHLRPSQVFVQKVHLCAPVRS
jgi:hypothetical protein